MRYTLFFLICFLSMASFAQKQKVIFDCDLGGDIDDAFAVALLLASQEEFEIVGLCMDHGNTPGRGQIAAKMLYELGMEDIPIYLGRHTVSVVGESTELDGLPDQYMWAENFQKVKPNKTPAADFIIESLNKYPGEIILFTVGPVVNIGDIIDKDPDALKKAKQVVSMFGSIEVGYGGGEISAEWNVRGSIEDGKKLMNSGANLLLAPLDVTDHVILGPDYLTSIFNRQTPLTDGLGAMYALWYKHADWATQAKCLMGLLLEWYFGLSYSKPGGRMFIWMIRALPGRINQNHQIVLLE